MKMNVFHKIIEIQKKIGNSIGIFIGILTSTLIFIILLTPYFIIFKLIALIIKPSKIWILPKAEETYCNKEMY
jgi:hypothetical protein